MMKRYKNICFRLEAITKFNHVVHSSIWYLDRITYMQRGRSIDLIVKWYYRDPGGSSYCAEATLFCDNVISK